MTHMRLLTFSMAAVLLLASCAPQPGRSTDRSPDSPPTAPARPLHVGLLAEPGVMAGKFGGGGTGVADYSFLFAAKLVHYDHLGNPIPVLVEQVPSLANGTWRVFEDSRMETLYRLRQGVVWHDGAELTANDVIFTWAAIMNPDLPAENREPEKFIESIEAIDSRTFLVRWKETFVFANSWDLEVTPRHILEPLLQRDPQGFVNASFWTRDWIGLGPYRLVDWVQGSHLRGQAFPRYVLGAPRIQDIVVHFVPDANQAAARMLAGALDLTLGNLIRVEEGLFLKERMEPQREGAIMAIPTKHRYGEFQYREPQPPPSRDVRLRRGMINALDRQLLVDTLLAGLTTPADMYLAPNDAAFVGADRVISKYRFDPTRALTLFQEAGWTKGSDGILRSPSGERFDLEVRTTEETQNVKEAQILADSWKQVGINTDIEIIPRAKQNDQEYRAKFPGISLSATSIAPDWMDKWQSDRIASEATRWRGGNRGAYSRPELDRLYRQYITTIDPAQRQDVLVALVKFASEDVTYVPLYYQVDVHAIRTGLKGLVPRWPGQSGMAFNAHEWYWE